MRKIRILFGMLFTFFVLYSVPLVSAAAIVEFPITVDEDYTKAMDFVDALNAGRVKEGLQPVQMDVQLEAIGMLRATEAVIGFAHYRPFNYPTMVEDEYGNVKGENLGAGAGTGALMYNAWYNSPGHKATMFDRDIRSVGVGCVLNEGTRYWILVTSEDEVHTPATATGVKTNITRDIPTETSRMQDKLFVQDWHFDSLAQEYTGNRIFYNKKGIGGRVGIFSNSIYKGKDDPAEVLGFRIPSEMLTFSTSTPEVLSVTPAGVVTPKSTGTGTITVSLKSDPSVSLTETIIVLSNVKNAVPTMTFLDGEDFNGTKKFTYTGKEICPRVQIVDCYGSVLEEGVDYNLEYSNNKEIGVAFVKAVFIGNYVTDSGQNSFASAGFYILAQTDPDSGQSGAGDNEQGGNTGSGNTGNIGDTVANPSGTVSAVPVSGSGASAARTVSVPKVTLKKVKASSKGSMTVIWKKRKKSDGYQIQYALNKKFTKRKKTKNVAVKAKKKGKKTYITSKTFRGLKSQKTYYVRMRTYKKINGKKYYSAWSKVKTVTTK